MLFRHGFVLQKLVVNSFRHTDRLDQMRIGCDVHRFSSGKAREHHANFRGREKGQVGIDVSRADVNVALCEKTEDLSQKVSLSVSQNIFPVLDVFDHRNLCPKPVHLLTGHECVIGPWIREGLVIITAFRQTGFHHYPSQARQLEFSRTSRMLMDSSRRCLSTFSPNLSALRSLSLRQ